MSYIEKIIEQTEHSTFVACMAAELVFILFLIAMIVVISLRFSKMKKELLNEKRETSTLRAISKIAMRDRD